MEGLPQKFDPSQLMQGVKDRIKATFVSLIPDEQWSQMVDTEVKSYFAKNSEGYRNEFRSKFTETVYDVLREETKAKVKDIINHPDFAIHWEGNNQKVSVAMKQLIIDKIPEIMASAMENMVGSAIQNLKNRGY